MRTVGTPLGKRPERGHQHPGTPEEQNDTARIAEPMGRPGTEKIVEEVVELIESIIEDATW